MDPRYDELKAHLLENERRIVSIERVQHELLTIIKGGTDAAHAHRWEDGLVQKVDDIAEQFTDPEGVLQTMKRGLDINAAQVNVLQETVTGSRRWIMGAVASATFFVSVIEALLRIYVK